MDRKPLLGLPCQGPLLQVLILLLATAAAQEGDRKYSADVTFEVEEISVDLVETIKAKDEGLLESIVTAYREALNENVEGFSANKYSGGELETPVELGDFVFVDPGAGLTSNKIKLSFSVGPMYSPKEVSMTGVLGSEAFATSFKTSLMANVEGLSVVRVSTDLVNEEVLGPPPEELLPGHPDLVKGLAAAGLIFTGVCCLGLTIIGRDRGPPPGTFA